MKKKIRVRIAVALAPSGHWIASGWSNSTDTQKLDQAYHADNEALYWLEADLEIPNSSVPESAVVEAKVERLC